ncbi:MAG: MFS transporter [Rubrobacteraceae bacterium]
MSTNQAALGSALDEASLTSTHWRVWFLSAMGVFLDGFDLFIMAVALPLIARDFDVSAPVLGLIGAAALIGAVVGAGVVGRLSDLFGRKVLYTIDLAFFTVFALLSGLAWDPASLIVFRFLLGVGVGADYPLSSTYITEFMPARIRGRMLVSGFSFQALGALAGAGAGILILLIHPEEGAWRYMLMLGVIPALIVVILRSALPESPRWAMAKGKGAEAAGVVSSLSGGPAQGQEPAGEESSRQVTVREQVSYRELFSSRFVRLTILACVPWFLMDVGLYGVGFFTPTILTTLNLTGTGDFITNDIASTEGAALLDIFLLLGFGLAILLVDRWGRITLQVLGFGGMPAGLLLLGASSLVAEGTTTHLILVFGGFALFNLLINMGPNATTFVLPAELFPTSVRASAHGLAASSGKVGAAVGVFLLPIFVSWLGLGITMMLLAGTSLLGLLVTWWFGTETRGRALDRLE